MIENIVFDIGNVILNFDIDDLLNKYTNNQLDRDFIKNNVINSPEWLGYALIDTGYISRDDAVKIVQDRTNHIKDELIENFWYTYNDYATVNSDVINLIKKLKKQNYKIYLLSNINSHTYSYINKTELFNIVDGYVLSYQIHQVKPYVSIYNSLIEKYNINPNKSLFVDDKDVNVFTANKLGFKGRSIKPDNYESILQLLKEYNIY